MGLDRRTNHLTRFRLTGAVWGWSYAFVRPSPVVRFHTLGLEIGITLAGERVVEAPRRGTIRYERGRISVFDLGEEYTTRYVPERPMGREVGFFVRADRIEAWTEPERVLRFARRGELTDARLVALAEALARGVDGEAPMPSTDVEAEVRRFVERHGELVPIDPLERARLELVRHFDKPLYMRHFAEIVGVHEETFARKFAARYGVTPARYRCLVRLKEAAVLLATEPGTPVREIARRVGFEDPAYFHRAFAAEFGSTPVSLARGFSDPAAA